MASFYFFRNCFTGAVAGGDVHSGGIADWIKKNTKGSEVYLIRPFGDRQESYYPETKNLRNIQYKTIDFKKSFALTFISRAILATLTVKLPKAESKVVLIASSHFFPDVIPVILKFRSKKDTVRVVYIHHIIQDMNRPQTLNTKLANIQEQISFFLIERYFNRIVVVNKQVASDLRNRGFHKQEILLSSNFVQRKVEAISYDKKVYSVIYCGRMVKQKGVYDFLDVCQKLQNTLPNFKAVMVGIGPEFSKLEALIKERNLNILLTGYVEDDNKYDYISKAKLFLFPSREEGWGIAIAESLTAGTPVIAYELEVYNEIFKNHLHTSPIGQIDLLAHKTEKLLLLYEKKPAAYKAEQREIQSYAKQFQVAEVARDQHLFLLGEK